MSHINLGGQIGDAFGGNWPYLWYSVSDKVQLLYELHSTEASKCHGVCVYDFFKFRDTSSSDMRCRCYEMISRSYEIRSRSWDTHLILTRCDLVVSRYYLEVTKLFLVVTKCDLVATICYLIITRYNLLVKRCNLDVTRCNLVVTTFIPRNWYDFVTTKWYLLSRNYGITPSNYEITSRNNFEIRSRNNYDIVSR